MGCGEKEQTVELALIRAKLESIRAAVNRQDILMFAMLMILLVAVAFAVIAVEEAGRTKSIIYKAAYEGALDATGHFKQAEDAYMKGYIQGVHDALGNPEQALAKLICQGHYNATVTIDGQVFQLTCENNTGGR